MEITNRSGEVDPLSRMERAIRTYTPKAYPGRVVLLVASERVKEWAGDPDFGWSALAGGGLDVRVVAGSHDTMFHEVNIPVLARELEDLLRSPVPDCVSRVREAS